MSRSGRTPPGLAIRTGSRFGLPYARAANAERLKLAVLDALPDTLIGDVHSNHPADLAEIDAEGLLNLRREDQAFDHTANAHDFVQVSASPAVCDVIVRGLHKIRHGNLVALKIHQVIVAYRGYRCPTIHDMQFIVGLGEIDG